MQDDNHFHETDGRLAELQSLLDDFVSGKLTEEQDARLQELAMESSASRRLYLKYLFMYGTMHQEHGESDKLRALFTPFGEWSTHETQGDSHSASDSIFPLLKMESDLLSSCDNIDEFGASTSPDPSEETSGGFLGGIDFSFLPGLTMVIASTLILSAVVILPIYWSMRPNDPKWAVVARVTKAIDCHWAQGEKWSQEGAYLTVDQLLDLETGLVEIEFSSGAKVVLQGPARFITSGYNNSRLDSGKLAAVVPEGAEGFTVCTPGMDVVDLGTEFGVSVDTNHKSDVHVFKGLVELEAATKSGKTKTIRLKKNEAVEYDKALGDVIPIPVENKKFVRDLHSTEGLTTNLKVVNPSFEVPDIRTVPEYEPEHGDTSLRPIYGWKVSGKSQTGSRIAMYQISPYTSPNPQLSVGPGATDGRQVVTVSLGVEGRPHSNWIYQSLGTITSADIGKTLKLTVDAGPRSQYSDSSRGNGAIFAGFALRVTPEQTGTIIGKPASFTQQGKIKRLKRLKATMPITVELVGQEVFVLLAVSHNNGSYGQYHFDNVQVAVEAEK